MAEQGPPDQCTSWYAFNNPLGIGLGFNSLSRSQTIIMYRKLCFHDGTSIISSQIFRLWSVVKALTSRQMSV